MRGKVITYENNSGLISGDDGKRYKFLDSDWPHASNPTIGVQIDFMPENEFAKDIVLMQSASTQSRGILAIACWFLGCLGVHRFIIGKSGSGFAMLGLTCSTVLAGAAPIFILGIIAAGIWALIDLVMILSGEFKDENDNAIKEWWPK